MIPRSVSLDRGHAIKEINKYKSTMYKANEIYQSTCFNSVNTHLYSTLFL